MKIYTKTGDDGRTGLFGGERVEKDDARVEAYGSVDETNACLGVARAAGLTPDVDAALELIQAQLFVLGAELATPADHRGRLRLPLLDAADAVVLEQHIDRLEAGLPALTSFVLPAGTAAASALHHARTVCRRAERRVVSIQAEAELRPELVIYLNRLSDLLFVMARHQNHAAGVPDVAWAPRAR
ncbi:MAG TPA: cob(I)yrinic acid a,c-diamide adenosyltransferase [Polyangiaceae bacterium]|nr:cob(I)yrinic acid a,c-diamide adenosyltransferase [Polyangiaceae bacterium]